jgi:hypothetical protein
LSRVREKKTKMENNFRPNYIAKMDQIARIVQARENLRQQQQQQQQQQQPPQLRPNQPKEK